MAEIVYIQWRDAYLREGWHSEKDMEEVLRSPVWVVESIGWLIDRNDDRIIICQSVSSNQSYAEILKIPVEAVIDFRILASPETAPEEAIDPTLPTLHHQETIYAPEDENTPLVDRQFPRGTVR